MVKRVVIAALFLGSHCSWAELVHPGYWGGPLPPVQWEEDVTPGYEPSIESVLVALTGKPDMEMPSDEYIKEYWASWGPGAVEELAQLRESEGWSAFGDEIRRLLLLSGMPEAQVHLGDWLREAVDALERDERDSRARDTLSRLAPDFGRRYGREAVDVLAGLLPQVSDRWLMTSILHGLQNTDTDKGARLIRNTIDEWAASDNVDQRIGAAQWLMQSDDIEDLRRAEQIVDELGEAAGYMATRVEYRLGRWRAQQPMAEVLDAE